MWTTNVISLIFASFLLLHIKEQLLTNVFPLFLFFIDFSGVFGSFYGSDDHPTTIHFNQTYGLWVLFTHVKVTFYSYMMTWWKAKCPCWSQNFQSGSFRKKLVSPCGRSMMENVMIWVTMDTKCRSRRHHLLFYCGYPHKTVPKIVLCEQHRNVNKRRAGTAQPLLRLKTSSAA